MPNTVSVIPSPYQNTSRNIFPEIANNPAREGQFTNLISASLNTHQRAQKNIFPSDKIYLSESVQKARALLEKAPYQTEQEALSALTAFDTYVSDIIYTDSNLISTDLTSFIYYAGPRAPEILKAFFECAPGIKVMLDGFKGGELLTFTYYAGENAPETLKAFLKYAPAIEKKWPGFTWRHQALKAFFQCALRIQEIQKTLPDFKNEALLTLTFCTEDRAPEVLEAFLDYAPDIMKALPDLTSMALAIFTKKIETKWRGYPKALKALRDSASKIKIQFNLKNTELFTLTLYAKYRPCEVLEAFHKYAPTIINSLDLTIKELFTLISWVGHRAPEVLDAFLIYAPKIKIQLNLTNKELLTLASYAKRRPYEVLEAFLKYAPVIKSLGLTIQELLTLTSYTEHRTPEVLEAFCKYVPEIIGEFSDLTVTELTIFTQNAAAEGQGAKALKTFSACAPKIKKALSDLKSKELLTLSYYARGRTAKVLQAFLQDAPAINNKVPALTSRALLLLSYNARSWAPEVLKAYLEYAPVIKEALPDLTSKAWVNLTRYTSDLAVETLKAFLKYAPKIKEALPRLRSNMVVKLSYRAGGRAPDTLEAFLKAIPKIKNVPDFTSKALITLTYHAKQWAPEVLNAFFTYAPDIKHRLTDLTNEELLTLTYHAGERADEVLKAFRDYGPAIIKALPKISSNQLAACLRRAGQKSSEAVRILHQCLPQIKEVLPGLTSDSLEIFMSQAEEGGLEALQNLPQKVQALQLTLPDISPDLLVRSVALLQKNPTYLLSFSGYISSQQTAQQGIDTEKLVKEILYCPNGAFNAIGAYLREGEIIEKEFRDVRHDWLMTVAMQRKGAKKLQVLFQYLSKNKKDFSQFNTRQLIQMSTFEESGLVGLSLLKKLQMSDFEEGGHSGHHLVRAFQSARFDEGFFSYLCQFRNTQLHDFGDPDAEDRLIEEFNWRLFKEKYESLANSKLNGSIYQNLNPQRSPLISTRRILELFAWGPATGLSLDIRRALFSKYFSLSNNLTNSQV